MKTTTAEKILPLILIVALSPGTARAAGEIKPGKWQFTTEMQLPAAPQTAPGAQPSSAANRPLTRTACIDPAHPIPAEEQCKLDTMKRTGSKISWAMTCNSPQGPVHSTGSGRYAGDTMEGTLTAHVPGPDGRPMGAPGRITGRYLGPCEPK
jgi:Protein of unknown function (DUF3617)